jgi:3-oxoacyl-(acyl-carrier-protein) synthase
MQSMKNPAARPGANRVIEFKAISSSIDAHHPTESHPTFQSQSLAIQSVLKRFPVSAAHAKVICELSGLGGRA